MTEESNSQAEELNLHATVPPELSDQRFDLVAVELFPDYSRSRLQTWIKQGLMLVDGQVMRPKDRVAVGQCISLNASLPRELELEPQALELDIVYEDEALLVINKPAGLVVHPAAGHADGTLLNALLHHHAGAAMLPRAGIVHRLDKDTTGLMVAAKTLQAHANLVAQLQAREVSREYLALCQGELTAGGCIETEIGRHPRHRQKMAVVEFGGKQAITHYRVEQRFAGYTLVRCKLETGRTHQIRVHMAHIHYPLVGDKTYGGRPKLPKAASETLINALQGFPRQALHAETLGLYHPETDDYCEWHAEIPEDMRALIAAVEEG